MVVVLPITPILVAIIVFILSLLTKASSNLNTIITICWVIVIVISVILIICNICRKTTKTNKILGATISITATIVTMIQSKNFLFGLDSLERSSLGEIIWFGMVLLWGGVIWIASIILCSYASFICIDDEEDETIRYIKAFGCIIGSILLSRFFGLL